MIFADLLLSINETANQETLAFMDTALKNYNNMTFDPTDPTSFNRTDLVVILGNAIDGRQWDGKDPNYLMYIINGFTRLNAGINGAQAHVS